jgi:cell division protein FtsB
MGNRIAKHIYTDNAFTQWENSTYYVRDASGNVMATYEREATGQTPPSSFRVAERHLYGSARLGIDTTQYEFIATTYTASPEAERSLGHKHYEISNHLGNVLSVITDQKLPVVDVSAVVSYAAVVLSATDYSPFGVGLYGRSWSEGYRFGFQGQEKDDELWKGSISYKYRIELKLLGRFISVDPLGGNYAGNSSYAFSMNRLIDGIELEGLEFISFDDALIQVIPGGSIELKLSNFTEAYSDAWEALDGQYQRTGAVYTDPSGQQHIGGIPKTVGSVISPNSSISALAQFLQKEGLGLDQLAGKMTKNNEQSLNNTRFKNNSNQLDGRFNATKHVHANMKAGRGLLALEVASTLYQAYSGFKNAFWDQPDINADKEKLKAQIGQLKQANKAIKNFFENNSVNPALLEGENAVHLARYVLTGEMTGGNDAIFDLGDDILISAGKTPAHRVDTRISIRIPHSIDSGNPSGSATPADNTAVKK